jgi:hypothetical protein
MLVVERVFQAPEDCFLHHRCEVMLTPTINSGEPT